MGTHQDNGFRDTERCCTYHNTACDCSDTARACVDGLQRPWWHGWLGRSFQYGLPVRLERAWRTRRRDELKTLHRCFTSASAYARSIRHGNASAKHHHPVWQTPAKHLPHCIIANLSVRPPECFQTVDQELEELLSQVEWMKC